MTTGIDAGQENLRLKLYPNPSSGEFMLDLGQAYSDVKLTIYSISGVQVATMHYQNKQRATIDFNADSGIYFLEVRANGKTQRLKLIKQ